MMIVPVALLVTFLLIVSFFLFFSASKTSGLTAAFGRLLGLWLLLLAAVVAGGVVTAHMNGGKPYGLDMPMMGRDGMRCCHERQPEAPPPAAPAAPAAQPAPVAPATPGG